MRYPNTGSRVRGLAEARQAADSTVLWILLLPGQGSARSARVRQSPASAPAVEVGHESQSNCRHVESEKDLGEECTSLESELRGFDFEEI